MGSLRAIVLLVGFVTVFNAPRVASQVSGQVKARIEQLGPEGLFVPPRSFAELVRLAQGAVVVDIVGLGDIVFAPSSTREGHYLGTEAFTTYNVEIREVLFNRVLSAPPLAVGSRIDLTQLVGNELAEAFVSKQVPVVPGDHCVLFLWYRPGAETWSLLQWPLQFRQPNGPSDQAEPLSGRPWHNADWFGPAVPLVAGGQAGAPGKVRLNWTALVSSAKLLGNAPPPR
jgi:hypothetical protein